MRVTAEQNLKSATASLENAKEELEQLEQMPQTAQALTPSRTWRDRSGKYSVVAALVSFDDKEVRLKKENGKVVSVPIRRLDKESQRLIDQLRAERKTSS